MEDPGRVLAVTLIAAAFEDDPAAASSTACLSADHQVVSQAATHLAGWLARQVAEADRFHEWVTEAMPDASL